MVNKRIVLCLIAILFSGEITAIASDFCSSSDERHAVKLVRQGAIGGAMATYRILANKNEVGKIKSRESFIFFLNGGGQHKIKAVNSIWGGVSNVLTVSTQPCGYTEISCSTTLLGKISCQEQESNIRPKLRVERGPEASRELATESIKINNCHSKTVAYDTISFKQESSHIARFEGGVKIDGRGQLSLPGVGRLDFGAEIGLVYGEEYGSAVEWGREIQVSADPGQHVIHYFVIREILENGVLHYGLRGSIRFSYLKDITIELRDTQYLPCH